MPRINYVQRVIDGKLTIDQISLDEQRKFVLNARRYLGLNRYAKPAIIKVATAKSDNERDLVTANKYQQGLAQLGFTITITLTEQGTNFWRNIRNQPVNGSLSIIGCSQWLMVNKAHKVVRIDPPNDNRFADNYAAQYYVDHIKGGWYVGYGGNPFVDLHPLFNPKLIAEGWQEPFHGVRSADGTELGYHRQYIDRYVATGNSGDKL